MSEWVVKSFVVNQLDQPGENLPHINDEQASQWYYIRSPRVAKVVVKGVRFSNSNSIHDDDDDMHASLVSKIFAI